MKLLIGEGEGEFGTINVAGRIFVPIDEAMKNEVSNARDSDGKLLYSIEARQFLAEAYQRSANFENALRKTTKIESFEIEVNRRLAAMLEFGGGFLTNDSYTKTRELIEADVRREMAFDTARGYAQNQEFMEAEDLELVAITQSEWDRRGNYGVDVWRDENLRSLDGATQIDSDIPDVMRLISHFTPTVESQSGEDEAAQEAIVAGATDGLIINPYVSMGQGGANLAVNDVGVLYRDSKGQLKGYFADGRQLIKFSDGYIYRAKFTFSLTY